MSVPQHDDLELEDASDQDSDVAPSGQMQLSEQALDILRTAYESGLSVEMERLYTRMTSFVAESHLPLPHVLMVLELVLRENVDQARQAYLGD